MKTKLAGKNLLLLELIIVILFFSIAATACVMLFGQAHKDSNDSRDLTNAVIMAQNAAEIFKATGEINNSEGDGLQLQAVNQENKLFISVYKGDEVIYELVACRNLTDTEVGA